MNDRFLLLGGHPAVDFVNTRPVLAGQPTELLAKPVDLGAWMEAAGLALPTDAAQIDGVLRGPAGQTILERAIAYREALRRGLNTIVGGGTMPRRVIGATNRLLQSLPVHLELQAHAERPSLQVAMQVGEPDHVLGVLAHSVANLLVAEDITRLRRCANPTCVLFFLDLTRSHTRRWCSMATCGNQAKQRGYHERHRGTR